MMMTVLMTDSVRELSPEARQAYNNYELHTFLYADDTLLVGYQQSHLQSFLDAVATTSKRYGLGLHWKKVSTITNQCEN